MGGLSRRNQVISSERAKVPVLVVEGGDSLAPAPTPAPIHRPGTPERPPPAPRSDEETAQLRLKAELVADAWKIAGIDAVALGARDWTLGSDWLRDLAARDELPVLAANLKCGGEAPFPASKVLEAGGKRIGVIGLTNGAPDGCEVSDPLVATAAAIAALGPVDFTLLLAPIDPKELVAMSDKGLKVDAALTAGGRMMGGVGSNAGQIPTFEAGSRGKEVGVVELHFTPGATTWSLAGQLDAINERIARSEQRLKDLEPRIASASDAAAKARWESQRHTYETALDRDRGLVAQMAANAAANQIVEREIGLGADVMDDKATKEAVDAAKGKLEVQIGKADPERVAHRMPPGSQWAGSDVCAQCHQAEHAQWAGTPHSHALASLATVQRSMDAECFSCHVTGAHQEGGPSLPSEVGPFRDVQCEACHGPGQGHVASRGAEQLVADPPASTCTGCHDGDRDGGRFDFPGYRAKIVHTAVNAPTSAPPPSEDRVPPSSPAAPAPDPR
jgi:predicted CXXCH cytochrome family protein